MHLTNTFDIGGAAFRDHHDVAAIRSPTGLVANELANKPFDAIAFDRISDFFAHGDSYTTHDSFRCFPGAAAMTSATQHHDDEVRPM